MVTYPDSIGSDPTMRFRYKCTVSWRVMMATMPESSNWGRPARPAICTHRCV